VTRDKAKTWLERRNYYMITLAWVALVGASAAHAANPYWTGL